MNPRIHEINKSLTKYRNEITNHALYKKLNSAKDIAVLMEHHAYAVWDFMSLLKALQSLLTCTSSPWKPVGDSKVRRLINSIVLEEESDVDADDNPSSHYEMYLDAMKQCGANTEPVEKFVAEVNEGYIPSVNEGIDSFLNTTFSVIDSQESHKIASAFTFGREDLIPDMFTAIVDEYNTENNLDKFVYYLERHIELDGGDHGPLALELICSLCGDDEKKWSEVEETAIACLQARKKLWDLILDNLN
tara:strand:+ start:169 stop:909 length:741 start_codon:yes stop_codon:yes gene_type:complete